MAKVNLIMHGIYRAKFSTQFVRLHNILPYPLMDVMKCTCQVLVSKRVEKNIVLA